MQKEELAASEMADYQVPAGEEHLFHCRIEVRKFNAETGERLSAPRVQKFGAKFFNTFGLHNLRQQGYTVEVLYDPTEWLAKHKGQAERVEESRRAAEREKLKAELLADLKAAEQEKEVGAHKEGAKK